MNQQEQHEWWLTFHNFQQSRETAWNTKIYEALQHQIKSATSVLKENGYQSAVSNLDRLIRFDELAVLIKNIYIDAGTVFGGKAYQLVRKQVAKNYSPVTENKAMMPIRYNAALIAEILNYFQLSLLNEAVLPISETTRDYILRILIRAQQRGESINDIVKELESTDITKNRARRIARTETMKAANYGSQQAIKKTGYQTHKIWISAVDMRTRRTPRDTADHLHMNGVTIPIDDDFKVPDKETGYDPMQRPGDPRGGKNQVIECRCTLGYKVITDANGIPLRA